MILLLNAQDSVQNKMKQAILQKVTKIEQDLEGEVAVVLDQRIRIEKQYNFHPGDLVVLVKQGHRSATPTKSVLPITVLAGPFGIVSGDQYLAVMSAVMEGDDVTEWLDRV